MEKMKALVFKDVGQLVLEQVPVPHVKEPDDVLLKIKAVGICGSDVKIVEGKHHFRPNTILGHEFWRWGVEIWVPCASCQIGDRVAVDTTSLRLLRFCRMGFDSQCVVQNQRTGVMRDGGMPSTAGTGEQVFVLADEIDDIYGRG